MFIRTKIQFVNDFCHARFLSCTIARHVFVVILKPGFRRFQIIWSNMTKGYHKATVIKLAFLDPFNHFRFTVVNRHGHFVNGKSQNENFGEKWLTF